MDAFLRWSRASGAEREHAFGWIYKTALRLGLDELRRKTRWARYRQILQPTREASVRTPEELHAVDDARRRVRLVLATLRRRDASLLLLRSQEMAYREIAVTLKINPASVGTLLARAEQAFRSQYERRYGKQ